MNVGAAARLLRYALVTPARNEERFIEGVLRSVVGQTQRPVRWIIVSDGSTDGTERIAQRYGELHPWIEMVRVANGSSRRNFASKAHAFEIGYERLSRVSYDVVGNLDADLSFDEGVFAFLMSKFAAMPDLGVAGPLVLDETLDLVSRSIQGDYVAGCCQLFRRECFEDVGGYVPIEEGGIDWLAVTTARMKGWKTKTFFGKTALHHRPAGALNEAPWRVWFARGRKEYARGGHPLWQVARGMYQARSRPYVVRGLMLIAGYGYGFARGASMPISRELVRFHRRDQIRRLKEAATDFLATPSDAHEDERDLPVRESLRRLERWVETRAYKGYEPFDGLTSYLRPLTFGISFLERLMIQVGRWSPWNLRPLLGIVPLESTKGRGYMASGHLAMLRLTGRDDYEGKAAACLDWLIEHKSPLHSDYAWGNHFDYASRGVRVTKNEPTIVWTALIGQTFLDAYETLGDERYLDVARSVCTWIRNLPRQRTAAGDCLSYVATGQVSIHNSNLLGAAMLARTARHTGDGGLLGLARAAMEYSCSRQLPNGAWYYAESPDSRWIDNFHTGYNLDCIRRYIDSSGDRAFAAHLDSGFRFFASFFADGDRPKYYHDRESPIDIQCAAQAIETLASFSDRYEGSLERAERVARWTIRNMQDPSGYFHYRKYGRVSARIPMIHWGQATMYKALAVLAMRKAEEMSSASSHRTAEGARRLASS